MLVSKHLALWGALGATPCLWVPVLGEGMVPVPFSSQPQALWAPLRREAKAKTFAPFSWLIAELICPLGLT